MQSLTSPSSRRKTIEALEDQHARAQADYESWKRDLLEWLHFEGKDPDRLRGYSKETLRNSNYKIDQIMRWLWNNRDYTTELTPDGADQLMKELGRYSEYGAANLNNFGKTIKRIFGFYNDEKGKNIGWKCKIDLNEPSVTNRDYFKKREFRPLYEASLAHGTVQHYHSCTPDERARLKAYLAQRFEKPKKEISPDDFDPANSMKIHLSSPSLSTVDFAPWKSNGRRWIGSTSRTRHSTFRKRNRARTRTTGSTFSPTRASVLSGRGLTSGQATRCTTDMTNFG